MNRLDDLTNAIENELKNLVSVDVFTSGRDDSRKASRPRRTPFIRIERPVIQQTFRNQTNKRLEASLLINAFSNEPGVGEINKLEEEVRNALDNVKLDLDSGRRLNLKPQESSSTPSLQDLGNKEVKQSAVEFLAIIHE